MTLFDVLFLASVLFVVAMCVWMLVLTAGRRWTKLGRTAVVLAVFLTCYTAALIGASLLRPRRIVAAGERRCFDDWCLAALTVAPDLGSFCKAEPGSQAWIVTLEVSSAARRVRQRATDASAELEDTRGLRYQPCAGPSGRQLSDQLGPGESFRVELPYRLPADAMPAGLVVHHGGFPGILIIGDDQSFLHPPTLWRVAPPHGR